MIWNISAVKLGQVTQQCSSHLLAHPQTIHCVGKKENSLTLCKHFSVTGSIGKKIIQSNPTSKAESAEACCPGLHPIWHGWRFYSLFAQPIQFDYFHNKKSILSWSDGIISCVFWLSALSLVVNTIKKSLSLSSFFVLSHPVFKHTDKISAEPSLF